MAHVDDLTFLNAAQLLNSDLLYVGRPSDGADPDKRTDIEELISRIIGPGGALPVESGVITPVLLGTTSDPVVTYNFANGYYVRIGQVVVFSVSISTSTISGGSGSVRIGGLPYPCVSGQNPPVSMRASNLPIASGHVPYAFVTAGDTRIGLGAQRDNAAIFTYNVSDWQAGGHVNAAGVYPTDPTP